MAILRTGTCSWKYDSWAGIVYSAMSGINFLEEYGKRYSTVEIDQWFWSLFEDIVKLPEESTVREYSSSVPDDFKFTVKVPNSITLTHHYNRGKDKSLRKNKHFLEPELFHAFLKTLQPMSGKIGVLMFQFEYLNKQKMSSQAEFIDRMSAFLETVDRTYPIGLEIRNPNYLNKTYFESLKENKVSHVFLEGYYMPPVKDVFDKFKEYANSEAVIRLHGPDRKKIEQITGGDWSKIVLPKDETLGRLPSIIQFFLEREVDVYINVNNHFEGSAPLTLEKIMRLMDTETGKGS